MNTSFVIPTVCHNQAAVTARCPRSIPCRHISYPSVCLMLCDGSFSMCCSRRRIAPLWLRSRYTSSIFPVKWACNIILSDRVSYVLARRSVCVVPPFPSAVIDCLCFVDSAHFLRSVASACGSYSQGQWYFAALIDSRIRHFPVPLLFLIPASLLLLVSSV